MSSDIPASAMDHRIWLFHDENVGDTNGGRALVSALGKNAWEINTSRWVKEDRLINPLPFLPPQPYPEIAMSTSNITGIFFLRALKLRSPRTICVPLGFMPVGALSFFDLIPYIPVAPYPEHPRAFKTMGVLTPVNEQFLFAEREKAKSLLPGLRPRKVAVLIGTRAVHCRFSENFFEDLIRGLQQIEQNETCSFLICANRRILPDQISTLRRAFPEPFHRFFSPDSGGAENPYWGCVALADSFVVTADSLSMISDAIVTSRAVYVAGLKEALCGGWARFFRELRTNYWIREFEPHSFKIEAANRPPLNEAARVAKKILEVHRARFGAAV